jgi:hypothetical protein
METCRANISTSLVVADKRSEALRRDTQGRGQADDGVSGKESCLRLHSSDCAAETPQSFI